VEIDLKRFALSLLGGCFCAALLLSVGGSASAASTRKVPAFEMRDLQERELRLSDDRFKDKTLLIAAFTTWNDVSRRQAAELEAFHKANPNVEIIAFVVNSLAEARDFVQQEGLTYPCYKADPVSRVGTAFQRLFETKKDKTLQLNRIPFAILADKDRTVKFANLGLTDARTLSAEYAKFK
jgi:peroxiredoxin